MTASVRSATNQRAVLLGAFRALLGSVALLPFLPWLLHGVPGLSGLGAACERWFSFQCQRDPSRALYAFGQALPVCARCSGIYFGFGLGACFARPHLGAPLLRRWVAVACLFMLLDVLSEALGVRPPWAPLRVLSGLLLAYPVGAASVSAARARWVKASSEAVLDAD
jgi:uncharacterized membrane protein